MNEMAYTRAQVRDRGARRQKRRWSARRRVVAGSAVLIGVLVLGGLVWAALLVPKALSVKDDLENARVALTEMKASRDVASLSVGVETVAQRASHAAQTADDPLWRAAEFVPFVGDNLRAARVASTTLATLAVDVGQPLLAVQQSGDGQLLARALPLIERAGDELQSSASELTGLASSSQLIGPVRSGVEEVVSALNVVRPLLAAVPPLLGADGERRYLLVFQNNAEVLPLGGSAASQTLITATGGELAVSEQGDSTKFRNGTAVDVPVDSSALEIYGSYLVDHVNTAVTRPDFPTAARILRAFWQRDIDPGAVDGVISVDPLALAKVLRATGPIQVSDVEINADNAVQVLLSDSYKWWDPSVSAEQQEASDGFFAGVARAVFERIASGSFDLQAMVAAVTAGIDQGSIMAWSDEPSLAAALAGQTITGTLPTDNKAATTVGVFFRDSSAAKIDYYMDSAVAVSGSCVDDAHTYDVTAKLHLNLTEDEQLSLPRYVIGNRGETVGYTTQVVAYGPPGTVVSDASFDAARARIVSTTVDDLGRPVAVVETVLHPGQEASVHVAFSGKGSFGPLQTRITPMIRPTTLSIDDQCR